MFRMLLKIISVSLVLFIIAGCATVLKDDANHISEGLFMALYLGVLITALIFIRRYKIIRRFIDDRINLPE
ncbi:hypothetical protein [Flavobacterium silvaticum]|uniref:Lipoprotein n=1 Tax=Flavobacterium silvaticum TaxID=1852020 RepID=A0A972FN71_9FLAO|nr:hypothetical protein [Flavobacterium silvaticum]NMH28787.1 hypothetical protein [Flavobacterium silvaticum]